MVGQISALLLLGLICVVILEELLCFQLLFVLSQINFPLQISTAGPYERMRIDNKGRLCCQQIDHMLLDGNIPVICL